MSARRRDERDEDLFLTTFRDGPLKIDENDELDYKTTKSDETIFQYKKSTTGRMADH